MKRFDSKFDSFDSKFDKFDSFDSKFDSFDSKFDSFDSKFDTIQNVLVKDIVSNNRLIHNPWLTDALTSFSVTLPKKFRKKCNEYFKCKVGDKSYKCVVTGKIGNSKQVVGAHLIPRNTLPETLARLGISKVHVFQNILIICKEIELAYDKLALSFVPGAMDRYVLKIWDPSVKNKPIFTGSDFKISEFEGYAISIPEGTKIYSRILCYHAYLASHLAFQRKWLTNPNDCIKFNSFGTPVNWPIFECELKFDNLHLKESEDSDDDEEDKADDEEDKDDEEDEEDSDDEEDIDDKKVF